MTSAEGVASSSPRSIGLIAAGAIVLSIALHVVPQLLRDLFDPAWSMLVLMIIDACAVALVVRSRTALLVGVVLAVLLGAAVWSHQQVLAALPSIVLNLMLAGVFGATLRRGDTPLIVRIAEFDDGVLAPQFRRYLRALTQAWAIFFATMAGLSLVLMLYAPFEWWSLFVNVLTWPLVGMMFAAEWMLRRFGFKELPPHTPLHIVAKSLAYLRQVGAMRVARRSG
jgi:uncharacterized membrane protein